MLKSKENRIRAMIATVPEHGDGEYRGWQTETYLSIATARVE